MTATREGLEAVVREQLTRVIARTLNEIDVPSVGFLNQTVETILNAADEYTSAEVGLLTPAERRRVLRDK